MVKGYNNVPSNWDWLFGFPKNKDAYAAYLKKLGPENNGLRLPGGQEDINSQRVLTPEFVDEFIELCEDGEVQHVLLKANFFDPQGAVMAYEKLEAAGIKVDWIEASNEPYMGMNIAWNFDNNQELVQQSMRQRRFLWIKWQEFHKPTYFKLLGQRYAIRVHQLLSYFQHEGYDIRHKISLAMPVPDTHLHKVFYEEVLKGLSTTDFGAVTYHVYGNPDDMNKLDRYIVAIELYHPEGKEIVLSETGAIHWGKHGKTDHVQHYDTPKHHQMLDELDSFAEYVEASHYYRHSGFGMDETRLFDEVVFSGQQGDYITRI